jgi:hypothetical protein
MTLRIGYPKELDKMIKTSWFVGRNSSGFLGMIVTGFQPHKIKGTKSMPLPNMD